MSNVHAGGVAAKPNLFLSPFALRSASQCSFFLHALIGSVMIGWDCFGLRHVTCCPTFSSIRIDYWPPKKLKAAARSPFEGFKFFKP